MAAWPPVGSRRAFVKDKAWPASAFAVRPRHNILRFPESRLLAFERLNVQFRGNRSKQRHDYCYLSAQCFVNFDTRNPARQPNYVHVIASRRQVIGFYKSTTSQRVNADCLRKFTEFYTRVCRCRLANIAVNAKDRYRMGRIVQIEVCRHRHAPHDMISAGRLAARAFRDRVRARYRHRTI